MLDHAAVSSDKSPLLIDGKLGVERAHETLRSKSSVGSPSLASLIVIADKLTIEVLPEELILEIFYFYKLACRRSYGWPRNGNGNGISSLMCAENGVLSYLPHSRDLICGFSAHPRHLSNRL